MSANISLSPLVYVHKKLNFQTSPGRESGQIIGFHGKHICMVEVDLFFLPEGGAYQEVSRAGAIWADTQAINQGCVSAHGQSRRAYLHQGKSFKEAVLGLRWKRCGHWEFKGRATAISFANLLVSHLPNYIVDSRVEVSQVGTGASVRAEVAPLASPSPSLRPCQGEITSNPVGQLQELTQLSKVKLPHYVYERISSGFNCRCRVQLYGFQVESEGSGISKKAAKRASAVAALAELGFTG